MTECILIGASPEATLPPQFTVGNSAVICADGGYDRAVSWGLHPDLVIGDFDSAHKLPEEPIPMIRLPQEKDDTDLLAAVKVAMEDIPNFAFWALWAAESTTSTGISLYCNLLQSMAAAQR